MDNYRQMVRKQNTPMQSWNAEMLGWCLVNIYGSNINSIYDSTGTLLLLCNTAHNGLNSQKMQLELEVSPPCLNSTG